MKILSEERYKHIVRAAGRTYRELMKVEAELEEEKRGRALAQAMAEGYANMTMKMEKEIEYYKNMYEREARKNAKLKMQNSKLWKRLLEAISADQIKKEGLTNEVED